ncbi:MAG: hypothetical protein Q7R78_01810 [bacterium]|nr:hypothetical protein [bacterium]
MAVFSATLSFFVYWSLGTILGRADALWLASMLIASVVIHELFHFITMEYMGVKTNLYFMIVAAYSIPDKDCAYKLREFSWRKNSLLLIAGVPGNLFLVLVTLLCLLGGIISQKEFEQVCFINGNIILFDLIIPTLADGSKVMRRLLGSARGDLEWMQRLAFGGVGISIFLTVSHLGGSFPPYWGFIFLADCWLGGRVGKWFRLNVWPKLEENQKTEWLADILKRKFGEKNEEFEPNISSNERFAWFAVYMVTLTLGAMMKYWAKY